MIKLTVVVPVFNEEQAIDPFLTKITGIFDVEHDVLVDFIFVNDGSSDSSLEKLHGCQKKYSNIKIIDLSRNFGKEAALTAGLEFALGDVVVPIDVDLQDPPELILEMIALWRDGYDVVLARRTNRSSEHFAKRFSAALFYQFNNKISDILIPDNVGDFRLMDQRVVSALRKLPESNRFMKGLFAWLGFRTTFLNYTRSARYAGTSKFNGWKLWNFALDGITSFSTKPLRIWTYVGLVVATLSFIWGAMIVSQVLFKGVDLPGYASLMVAVIFLGGLQLIGIGVIGEYLGRAYMETKRRPIYIIREIYELEDE